MKYLHLIPLEELLFDLEEIAKDYGACDLATWAGLDGLNESIVNNRQRIIAIRTEIILRFKELRPEEAV